MAFRIIGASERMQEKSGVKAVIAGEYGIGKTSLLRTLDPSTTLFIDGEAGDLAVQDVQCDTMRPATWTDCRFLAAYIGGPNPAFPPGSVYGLEHHAAAVEMFGAPDALDRYDTIFVDSFTKLSRLALQWAQQQPEAFASNGKPDLRSAYGLLGRELIAWVQQLQHVRGKNVIITCAAAQVKDDFGRLNWELHIDGSKAARELPGIVDEVIFLAMLPYDDDGVTRHARAFFTAKDNEFGYPAKDRSGRLEPIEEPDLGKLIAKCSDSERRRANLSTKINSRADATQA